MYSYREFKDIQSKAIMSYEERLEKRNNDIMTQCITESYKKRTQTPKQSANENK